MDKTGVRRGANGRGGQFVYPRVGVSYLNGVFETGFPGRFDTEKPIFLSMSGKTHQS